MSSRIVLVIDDDAVVRRMIARLLQARNIECRLAATGEEGLARFAEDGVPDVLVCDLFLPGMSGIEVLEQVRARAEWSGVPVVVLTGRARGEMMVRAEALGDRIVTKPFSSVDLVQVIESLFRAERCA